jgi:hypothetical protein
MEATGLSASLAVYPNPSNGNVRVVYTTKTSGHVTIELWDEAGTLIQKLFSGEQSEGQHDQSLAIPEHVHGNYFVRLASDGQSTVTRLSIP